MIAYVDEKDKEKFTEEDFNKAKKDIPSYLLVAGNTVTDCVFYNETPMGRVLTIPILLEPNDEDDYCQPSEDAKIDGNGLFDGLMFVYAYNMDEPSFSEAGSANFAYNDKGELRRVMHIMQCFAF